MINFQYCIKGFVYRICCAAVVFLYFLLTRFYWRSTGELELRGLIYKGIYAQKMAYASFYAMFAIYKILT